MIVTMKHRANLFLLPAIAMALIMGTSQGTAQQLKVDLDPLTQPSRCL